MELNERGKPLTPFSNHDFFWNGCHSQHKVKLSKIQAVSKHQPQIQQSNTIVSLKPLIRTYA